MQIFVAKDKKENKGYIVLHNNEAFLIDPKGDYRVLKRAMGDCQLKAIFLTSLETDTLPLLAAFGGTPIYVENTNGIRLQKMHGFFNLSMIKFIFVKQILSFKMTDLQIGLLPTIGINKQGGLITIFNNNFFVGDVVIDAKFSKKALKLGPSSFLHKLVTIILNNQHNIVYPSKSPGFPAYKIIRDNPQTRSLLPRRLLGGTPPPSNKPHNQSNPKQTKPTPPITPLNKKAIIQPNPAARPEINPKQPATPSKPQTK